MTEKARTKSHADFEPLWSELAESEAYWGTLAQTQFATSIRAALRAMNVTQTELAERIGWKPAQVSRALNGSQNLTLRSMVKLCRALQLRLDLSAKPENSSIRPAEFQPSKLAYTCVEQPPLSPLKLQPFEFIYSKLAFRPEAYREGTLLELEKRALRLTISTLEALNTDRTSLGVANAQTPLAA